MKLTEKGEENDWKDKESGDFKPPLVPSEVMWNANNNDFNEINNNDNTFNLLTILIYIPINIQYIMLIVLHHLMIQEYNSKNIMKVFQQLLIDNILWIQESPPK